MPLNLLARDATPCLGPDLARAAPHPRLSLTDTNIPSDGEEEYISSSSSSASPIPAPAPADPEDEQDGYMEVANTPKGDDVKASPYFHGAIDKSAADSKQQASIAHVARLFHPHRAPSPPVCYG